MTNSITRRTPPDVTAAVSRPNLNASLNAVLNGAPAAHATIRTGAA
jgi:hypothetical protein